MYALNDCVALFSYLVWLDGYCTQAVTARLLIWYILNAVREFLES